MSEFENLLNDLEQLKKSEALNDEDVNADKKIKMASEDDNEQDDPMIDDEEGDEAEDGMEKCGDITKSMTATLDDGAEAQVIEAGAMIKSLQNNIASAQQTMTKSIEALQATIAEQGTVLKALGEQVVRMAKSGSGRKSVITTAPMVKSESSNTVDVLAKCERAMSEGRLSGVEMSVAEAYVNRGMAIPQDILSKL